MNPNEEYPIYDLLAADGCVEAMEEFETRHYLAHVGDVLDKFAFASFLAMIATDKKGEDKRLPIPGSLFEIDEETRRITLKQAVALLEECAHEQHFVSMVMLARCYADGLLGCEVDFEKALEWTLKARPVAEAEKAEAMKNQKPPPFQPF